MASNLDFFAQLKQRKLVRWTPASVATAFALLQGIGIVAQRFGWPEQTIRFVIIVLSVGFFVTLFLSWYPGALLLALGRGFLWKVSLLAAS